MSLNWFDGLTVYVFSGLSRWNDSLLVDLRLAGLVEAWAAGATWSQVMADSTLDDGDVARLLMRVADLLRQVDFVACMTAPARPPLLANESCTTL